MSDHLTNEQIDRLADISTELLGALITYGVDFDGQKAVITQKISRWERTGWFSKSKKMWERSFEIRINELPSEYRETEAK